MSRLRPSNDVVSLRDDETVDVSGMCVSIIIPYFRRPVTLRQTLLSLTNQIHSLDQVEVIIVDDGSPPSEAPDISQVQDILKCRVLWQEDLGYRLSKARNFGISQATHDNIIILDCDLAVSPMFISRHLKAIAQDERIISVGIRDSRCVEESIDESVFGTTHPSLIGDFLCHDWRIITHLGHNEAYAKSSAAWTLCSGGNVAFCLSAYLDIGPYDERFVFWGGEDTEWAYRAYKKGYYFDIDLDVHSYHFESRESEYQTDRYFELERKNLLLRDLVPAFESGYLHRDGEIPYVSVFMTHFNKLDYLAEALASVPKATCTRFEIVLVDDCSDCTEAEIRSKIPTAIEPYVNFVRLDHHTGVESCYAHALSLCRGEFIAQLDADDYLLPGAIDILIDRLKDTDADIAFSKYQILEDGSLRPGWSCADSTRNMRLLSGMYYHPLRVFRSRVLSRAGGMRSLGLSGGVDFSLYSQLEIVGEAVFCDTYTYVYRKVDTSISCVNIEGQISGVEVVVNANAKVLFGEDGYSIRKIRNRVFEVVPN